MNALTRDLMKLVDLAEKSMKEKEQKEGASDATGRLAE